MNISHKKNKSGSVLKLEGELTIYAVSQAKKDLLSDVDSFVSPVSLDIRDVSEIDTAGIQLLLFLKKILNDKDKKIFVEKSNEQVDGVITMLNLTTQFSLSN